MSYLDLSNGCNSCSGFSPIGDMSMNSLTALDQNTNFLANMVATGVSNNSNNVITGVNNQSNYPNQGTQQLGQQNIANHFNNTTSTNFSNNNNNSSNSTNPQNQNTLNLKKQIVDTKYKMNANNNNNSSNDNSNNNSNDTMNSMGSMDNGSQCNFFIMMGVVFVIALSWNETIKFYINQAIKFNDGSPSYYVGYTVVATLFGFALYHYINK